MASLIAIMMLGRNVSQRKKAINYQQNVLRAKQQGPWQEAAGEKGQEDGEGVGRDSEEEERVGSGVGRGREGRNLPGGQAEMNGARKNSECPILRISLERIGPAEDTFSDSCIHSIQDLMY
jgi:hypothetical protein